MYKEKDEQLLNIVRKGQVPLKLDANKLLSATRKKDIR